MLERKKEAHSDDIPDAVPVTLSFHLLAWAGAKDSLRAMLAFINGTVVLVVPEETLVTRGGKSSDSAFDKRSVWSVWLVTYQGPSKGAVSVLDCKRWIICMLETDTSSVLYAASPNWFDDFVENFCSLLTESADPSGQVF